MIINNRDSRIISSVQEETKRKNVRQIFFGNALKEENILNTDPKFDQF